MGCYNGTCGITQIAITWNDPVVGFLLRKNFNGSVRANNGHCHSTGFWSPFSLHIEGDYNDYGTIENVDEQDWNFLFTLERLKQNVVEKENDKEYSDNSIKKDDINNWKYIGNAIHEDNLEISVANIWGSLYPNEKTLPIGFMMIHGDVFDSIINSEIESWRGDVINIENLMKDGRKVAERFKERIKEEEAIDDENEKLIYRYRYKMDLDHSMDRNKIANCAKFRIATDYGIMKECLDYLFKEVSEHKPDEDLEKIIRKMSEFYMLDMAMMKMRKTWMPQAGAGSQDDEVDLHLMINDATRAIFEKRKTKWDED